MLGLELSGMRVEAPTQAHRVTFVQGPPSQRQPYKAEEEEQVTEGLLNLSTNRYSIPCMISLTARTTINLTNNILSSNSSSKGRRVEE